MVELKASWKLYNEQKVTSLEAKVVDDFIKLLQLQNGFQRDLGHTFINLSLADSISKSFQLGHATKSNKLKSEFRVSDKKMMFLEFRSIIDLQNWDGMEMVCCILCSF